MADLTPLRARALSTLQGLRGRRDPSSFEWHVADKAIDLALSPLRPEGAFLVRDCLRNARSVVSVARARSRAGGLDPTSPDHPEAVELVVDDAPDQFETLAWAGAYRDFTRRVAGLHRHAAGVLSGFEADEPIPATAAALGVSERLVKSLRATIRAMSGAALVAGRA